MVMSYLTFCNIVYRELHLNNNHLRVLPYELGKLFQLHILGLQGNPLTKEILTLYGEPNGTHKLLTYMLDNLQGKTDMTFANFKCKSVISSSGGHNAEQQVI
jgi:Leucine-rich repeat (LRR) protein